ncbi:hypothetical protein [Novosphingobium marinum]|uniref:Uncharacterized protein n=1 Tax=Novosphingobium marinum TaxID=1514948 RepID=A0A7Y9XWL3_9SPHN|nr:hypothetical protein [Novosphingobium marinum]NYH94740.1 hypothetical protein [Novosphingobium marinum]
MDQYFVPAFLKLTVYRTEIRREMRAYRAVMAAIRQVGKGGSHFVRTDFQPIGSAAGKVQWTALNSTQPFFTGPVAPVWFRRWGAIV